MGKREATQIWTVEAATRANRSGPGPTKSGPELDHDGRSSPEVGGSSSQAVGKGHEKSQDKYRRGARCCSHKFKISRALQHRRRRTAAPVRQYWSERKIGKSPRIFTLVVWSSAWKNISTERQKKLLDRRRGRSVVVLVQEPRRRGPRFRDAELRGWSKNRSVRKGSTDARRWTREQLTGSISRRGRRCSVAGHGEERVDVAGRGGKDGGRLGFLQRRGLSIAARPGVRPAFRVPSRSPVDGSHAAIAARTDQLEEREGRNRS